MRKLQVTTTQRMDSDPMLSGAVHAAGPNERRHNMMGKKQLLALFGCSLVGWTIAQGTLALLPVYAVGLGAPPASTGTYLSLAFLALTLGTLATGWLADTFQHRRVLIKLAG